MTDIRDSVYLRLVVPVGAVLPAWFAYGLALVYADIRSRLSPTRFQEVVLCLEYVVGRGLDAQARIRVARSFFRNRACMRVDAIRLWGDGRHLSRMIKVRGEDLLREALSEGMGVILCSAHYGSVRACAALFGVLGYRVTLVAMWSFYQKRRLYQVAWGTIRHHLARHNIFPGGNIAAAVQMAQVLKKNELIFTLVDARAEQDNRRRAVGVSVLHNRALILPGVSTIAGLTGAPLLPTFLRRSNDWRHLELQVLPRIPVSGDGKAALQSCVDILEVMIRADPSQWELWSMRSLVRLGLYPEDKAVDFYVKNRMRWEEL